MGHEPARRVDPVGVMRIVRIEQGEERPGIDEDAQRRAAAAGRTRARILMLDQTDHLREDGVAIEVQPAWPWMEEQ